MLSRITRMVEPEALFWAAGLAYLATSNPSSDRHYNFCLHRRLGFGRCTGCGLGRSISHLLHGELRKSFEAHPLGVIATFILLARITSLVGKGIRALVDQ